MKKTLSLILALTMIVSLFAGLTVTASADNDGVVITTASAGWELLGGAEAIDSAAGIGPVVITMKNSEGTYALTNDHGTGTAPGAKAVTVSNGVIPADDDDSNMIWYLEALEDGGYVLYADEAKSTWLYCTNTNNGVRVGTNENKSFSIDSDYLKNDATGRYVGIYISQDWRCYTSINSNITGQTLQFWKLSENVSVHEHNWSAWTSNGDGTHSRSCLDEDCPENAVETADCIDEDENLVCDVCGGAMPEEDPNANPWILIGGADAIAEAATEDIVTVTMTSGGKPYALSNGGGTSSSPAAVPATVKGDRLALDSGDNAAVSWNIEAVDGGYAIFHADNSNTWLYSTNSNSGVRVGINEAKVWTVEDSYLKHVGTGRYMGVYNKADWRAYTSINNNITGQTLQFWKYVGHVHDWDEGTVTREPSCTEKGVMTYTCTGCDETYTEDIPMIPHADGDADGLCDACEGRIFTQAESLNDGDSLILVTGAFGKAMTGTESSNGGYMAAAEINAQEGVTVPVAEDNVWTVKTADEGFYLINNAGQYLYVNESNKLALGDEESSNILWTVGESVEDLEPTGAYLYNPGAEKYIEYGKKYNNYQTYDAPTENYETCYAFTFYTLPAPMASYSLAPTEFTLAGAGYTDIECSFTSLVLGLIDVGGGETEMAESIGFMMNAGTLTNEDGGTIPFLVDDQFHFGAVERANTGVGISDPEETVIMAIWIDPEIYAAAAPGIYTGTFTYESDWNEGHPGEPGSIELTLVVPEPEPLDDGFYLLIAHGEDDWVIGSVDPANKFELNGNAQNEWLLSTTLAVEDQIKVVRVENNAITGWWPNGEHTQYHVDEAHSGNVTIYFKTDYVDAWRDFGGYFYIGSLLKPELFADVYGCSVSLKGNIGLNFYLIPSEQLLDDDDAYVSLGDEQIKFSEAPSRVVGEDTLYQFSVSLHAKQMNDVVTLKVFDGQGNPVALYRHSNDEDLTETGYSYSVQDYIQKTRETSTDEELIALVNAMADYGVLAQRHFDYNTEDLPEVQGDLDSVTAESVADYEKKVTAGTATGVSFAGGSLALKSATAIRLYFSLDEGEIGDYTFKLGTRKVTPTETDLGWMVEIPNIAAKDLDKTYTVKVTRGADTVLTVQYSALSYAYGVLGGGSKAETLIDLVKGIVLYNRAANAYFG